MGSRHRARSDLRNRRLSSLQPGASYHASASGWALNDGRRGAGLEGRPPFAPFYFLTESVRPANGSGPRLEAAVIRAPDRRTRSGCRLAPTAAEYGPTAPAPAVRRLVRTAGPRRPDRLRCTGRCQRPVPPKVPNRPGCCSPRVQPRQGESKNGSPRNVASSLPIHTDFIFLPHFSASHPGQLKSAACQGLDLLAQPMGNPSYAPPLESNRLRPPRSAETLSGSLRNSHSW